MRIKRPEIILANLQFKSLEIAQTICAAVGTIETNGGIHSTRITIVDPFICPDIDLDKLCNTPMEILFRGVLTNIRNGRCGKHE